MNRKNINIVVLLIIVAIAIFVVMQFLGFNLFSGPQAAPEGDTNSVLTELQETGTVADLRIQEITPGTGPAAKAGDIVLVHYTGVLPDGTVFDSSRNGDPYPVTLGEGSVIQGWERGLLGMQSGSRRLLVIPPSLAYGASGYGPIPPNATLIFDVEIVAIQPAGGAPVE